MAYFGKHFDSRVWALFFTVCVLLLLWLSVIYGIFVAQSVDRRIIFYHACFIRHQITVVIGQELWDCTHCKNELESHVVKWNIWNSSFFFYCFNVGIFRLQCFVRSRSVVLGDYHIFRLESSTKCLTYESLNICLEQSKANNVIAI